MKQRETPREVAGHSLGVCSEARDPTYSLGPSWAPRWPRPLHTPPHRPVRRRLGRRHGSGELVGDFYAEVLRLCEADAQGVRDRMRSDDGRPQDVYLPLLTAGWRHMLKTDGTQYFRSPDGYGVLEHVYAPRDLAAPV